MPCDIPFERLTNEHPFLSFDCGDDDLNDYFYSDSIKYQQQLLSVTYYMENDNETVLFFSLLNDKITALEHSNGFWRKIKSFLPHSKHRKDYPAVKIGRLGVNKKYQHTCDNWGSMTLDFIKEWMVTDNKTGCRFITVDAYHSAVPFYLKNGFLFMGQDEKNRYENNTDSTIAMYFDLIKIANT